MRKLYTLLFLCLLFTSSCEDLIDVNYPTDQIGTTQVFEDVQTANSALAGLYAVLRDQSIITDGNYNGAGSLLASYTDDLDCYFNDQNGVMDIYQNQQQETNTDIANIWETAYTQVYYANSIIYGADKSTALSSTDKNRIRGEALLIRSLIYFYLQQLFGDIPYTTSLDYEYNRKISKTGSALVLELLEADLTEATGLLQDEYRNSERIYPNRKTAQLLLARIYLLREEWSQAEKMADTILLSPLYQFQTDINEVFHKSGNHILWQLEPENSGDATWEESFYYFSGAAPHSYALTGDLVNSFATNDLRKQVWITEVTYNGESWYRPYKYKNLSGSNYNEYSIVFRLEEVYFIMAEALAMQNRFDEALPYLNATRERAGLTAITSLSGDDFYTELQAEKRREFFCESGHRFLDLKRWGKLDELSALKTNWEDFMQVWPLPQSEMLLNSNLSPQNDGY
jgi:starch-binding outer membrane protein, SusD/RagB family